VLHWLTLNLAISVSGLGPELATLLLTLAAISVVVVALRSSWVAPTGELAGTKLAYGVAELWAKPSVASAHAASVLRTVLLSEPRR
jgi:hypothetical protein